VISAALIIIFVQDDQFTLNFFVNSRRISLGKGSFSPKTDREHNEKNNGNGKS